MLIAGITGVPLLIGLTWGWSWESSGTHRPDDGGSTHLWNVGRHRFDYRAVYPRRLWTSYSPPWEPEISHNLMLSTSSQPVRSGFTPSAFRLTTLVSQGGGRDGDDARKKHCRPARLHAAPALYRRGRCPAASLYRPRLFTSRWGFVLLKVPVPPHTVQSFSTWDGLQALTSLFRSSICTHCHTETVFLGCLLQAVIGVVLKLFL
jgi:hypothetical protein